MDFGTVTLGQALALVDRLRAGRLLDDEGTPVAVLRVHGSPRSGKSALAGRALLQDDLADEVRSGSALLICSHRSSADEASEQIVRHLGTTGEQRPAKTMPALAFRLLRDARRAAGLSEPKLVNGAEQDAAISAILRTHLHHATVGDDCATCGLLRHYLAVRQAAEGADKENSSDTGNPSDTADTAAAFEALMTPAFTAELRDMFARLSELSLTPQALGAAKADPAVTARQGDEWDLSSALHQEYLRLLAGQSGPYRVDSSEILVRARDEVSAGRVPKGRVPAFLVIDDCQDLTLAAYSLVRALAGTGTRIVLIGCDDESVQTFRGAYPEVLTGLETAAVPDGGLGVAIVGLAQRLDEAGQGEPDGQEPPSQESRGQGPHADTYRLAVASRLSRSIGSVLAPSDVPVPKRPGKLAAAQAGPDDSLVGRLFRSHEEENEDLVWQIRHCVEGGDAHFNDCAVIAHDNAVLRAAGRTLEQQGVPVAYSSVTRALKEIPVIRGLLGLLRLTAIPDQTDPGRVIDVAATAALIRRVLATPLFGVREGDADPRPVRLEKLTSAFDALSALSAVEPADGTDRFAALRGQVRALRDAQDPQEGDQAVDGSPQDDIPAQGDASAEETDPGRRISADELLVLLLVGDDAARDTLSGLLGLLTASRWQSRRDRRQAVAQAQNIEAPDDGTQPAADPRHTAGRGVTDPDAQELLRLVAIVRKCAARTPSAGRLSTGIHARLWQVWQATGVADAWQQEAVTPTPRGRAVNEWLDAVIRLFAHAQQAPDGQSVADFLSDIEGLQIEADSLASLAPRPDAVVLATPAGAATLHKKYVWILAVQDGVWPNLSPRDALFDGQSLSSVVMRARLRMARAMPQQMSAAIGASSGQAQDAGHIVPVRTADPAQTDDPWAAGRDDEQAILAAQDRDQRLDLLYTESKSLLVALTRAGERTVVSAVNSEEEIPSDFLTAFLPELFTRDGLAAAPADDALTYVADGIRYSKVGRDPTGEDTELPWLGGLDADPEGMAEAARLALAAALSRQEELTDQIDRLQGADGDMEEDAADGDKTARMRDELLRRHEAVGRTIRDAAQALRLLARQGVTAADPSSWAFVASAQAGRKAEDERRQSVADDGFDVTAARNAGLLTAGLRAPVPEAAGRPGPARDGHPRVSVAPADDSSSTSSVPSAAVPISPSAVDAIWRCPLCWSLDNRFAGPRPTNASQSVGTLIHKVAQWATDTGLDRTALTVGQMTARLREQFDALLAAGPQFSDPDQVFRLAEADTQAGTMLARMASYFVFGREPGYAEKSPTRTSPGLDGAGTLEQSRAEVPVSAVFTLHDIGGYVRRTPGLGQVDDHELFVVLSWLAGGFPQGTREDLRLRLSARIDRLERRGAACWDILDWKTGTTQLNCFSDLQLVCYQLGLTFSGVAGRQPRIDRSMLFQLRNEDFPASRSRVAQAAYQPPLFVDGHINTVFVPRPGAKNVSRLFSEKVGQMDHSSIDDQSPVLLPRLLQAAGTGDRGLVAPTDEEASQAGLDLLPWSLSMIARVFYAGACLQTGTYPSRHVDGFDRYKQICPQWPVESATVYGRLHAGHVRLGADGRLVAGQAPAEQNTPGPRDAQRKDRD